jgi:hypothetical protein
MTTAVIAHELAVLHNESAINIADAFSGLREREFGCTFFSLRGIPVFRIEFTAERQMEIFERELLKLRLVHESAVSRCRLSLAFKIRKTPLNSLL